MKHKNMTDVFFLKLQVSGQTEVEMKIEKCWNGGFVWDVYYRPIVSHHA